jgi:hypothetical protein
MQYEFQEFSIICYSNTISGVGGRILNYINELLLNRSSLAVHLK